MLNLWHFGTTVSAFLTQTINENKKHMYTGSKNKITRTRCSPLLVLPTKLRTWKFVKVQRWTLFPFCYLSQYVFFFFSLIVCLRKGLTVVPKQHRFNMSCRIKKKFCLSLGNRRLSFVKRIMAMIFTGEEFQNLILHVHILARTSMRIKMKRNSKAKHKHYRWHSKA